MKKRILVMIMICVVATGTFCLPAFADSPTQQNENISATENTVQQQMVVDSPKKNSGNKGMAKSLPPLKNLKPRIVIPNPGKWRPSHSRVVTDIRQLKSQYPGLIQYSIIGNSAAGKSIYAVTLGRGEKQILIVSAMHAKEHVTALQAMRSIDTYAYAYAKNQKIDGQNVRKILDEVTFHFIPLPNPDGVAIVLGKANPAQKSLAIKAVGKSFFGKNGRTTWKGNANSVNLNRNFPVLWHDQYSGYRTPTSMQYPGKSAGSEPETQVLMAYCRAYEFAFMLSNHTYGQVLYWEDPLTGTIPGGSKLMNKIRSVTGYVPDPTLPNGNGGRFEKWFRYVFNRPAVVVEMLPPGYGIANGYKNFESRLWKRTKSLYLQVHDVVSVGPDYKLYFDPAGGKVNAVRKGIRTNRAVGTLPVPTRAGYKFSGWYTAKSGGTRYLAKTVFEGKTSVQLYARWKKA